MFHLLFGASRPLQHNKAPKPGDRGQDTARVSDRTVSPPPPFPLFLLFSLATSVSSNLFLSPFTFLHHLFFLAVYIPLLFIIPFFFCFSIHDAGPPSFFLPACFCLLREESASYGFYSLVVPPLRIPLSSPPNRPLFLHLGFFSIPYVSPFHYLPSLSQIARLTLHWGKSNQISLILTDAIRISYGNFFENHAIRCMQKINTLLFEQTSTMDEFMWKHFIH